jgi:hypothetical protein
MADEPALPTGTAPPLPDRTNPNPVNPGPNPGANPPARSNVAATAQRLVAEYTLTRFENNSEPDIRYVMIRTPTLFSSYSNTLKPIVYGNFRNIGARTVTDAVDTTFLDNVIRTVATNAVVATYAVAYNKAARIDASSSTRFGDYDPVDCLRFPTLTTHLVNSFGPVEATQLPYKSTFIPVIPRQEVENLLTQQGYVSHYYESFLQAMKRGRTIAMSDVDVNTRDSTHWWTLYYENVRPANGPPEIPGHISAYSPFSFDERSSTVLLASVVVEDTLYELPGPVIVHTLGPFAATREPQSLADLPHPYNGRTYFNRHVPAIAYLFEQFGEDGHISEAGLVHCSHIQEDERLLNETQLYVDLGDEAEGTGSRTKKKKNILNEGASHDALDAVDSETAQLYTCKIMYFDHKLANSVPHKRRSNIVTSANSLE